MMPHISDKKLKDENFNKIYDQLIKVFDSSGTARKSDILLKEFLTETEKIMLAKRLAIVFMLYEGISNPYISHILLVSPSTVDRISLRYESEMYPHLKKIIKKNSRTIWDVFENMISESVSHRIGKRRMAWLNNLERKYNRKIFRI